MTTAWLFCVRNLQPGVHAATRAYGYTISDFPPTLIDIVEGQKPPDPARRLEVRGAHRRVVDETENQWRASWFRIPANWRLVRIRLRRVATAVTDDRGILSTGAARAGSLPVGVLPTRRRCRLPSRARSILQRQPRDHVCDGLTLVQSGFLDLRLPGVHQQQP